MIFLIISGKIGNAQNANFGRITVEDGLSNSYVNCVLQDRIGFIWFGTDDGLNRFDGYDIKVYRNNPGNSTSLSDNIIWSLFEDQDGFLWIGTKSGKLNRYDPFTDRFEHFPLDSNLTAERNITFITQDKNNNIWIGTYRNGLYRYNQLQNNFDHWQNDFNTPKILSNNFITSIIVDDKENTWVSTYSGLNKFNPDTPQKPFSQILNDIFDVPIWNLLKSAFFKNYIWIGKLDGLGKFNPQTEEYSQMTLPASSGLQFGNSVSSIVEEEFAKEKILWIGTFGGLVRKNLTTGQSERFVQNEQNPSGLLGNQINNLIIDKSGVVWIATDNGLNFYSPKRSKFNFPISRKFISLESSEIKNGNIRAITQANDGALWFGAEAGLFSNNNLNKINKIIKGPGLQSLNVWCLIIGSSNKLWIGTYGQGLKELNLKTNEINPWKVENSEFDVSPYYYVKSILQDDIGMLWIGFWGGGLARLNPLNKKIDYWRQETDNPEGLSYNDVWTIYQDKKGRIWVGTNGGGLNLFDMEKQNKFYKWKANSSIKQSLSSNNIYTISEAVNNDESVDQTILWIGTANGLNKFIIKNDRGNHQVSELDVEISYYTVNEGLPDNSVESILEDKDGNLWIGTSNGLSFFNVEKETFANYGSADGLTGGPFNSSAAFQTKDGIFLFGSTTGLNFFDPEKISHSNYSPPIVITNFQIFNQPANLGKESPLKQSIFYTEEIILNYNQNDFSFQYASLDYNAPKNNQYAYKMEGFDKEWIYSGTRRFVTYTNLYPGEYVFHVKATNSDGIWNEVGTSLAIIINPPFWRTWWAYSSYAIILISMLGLIRSAEIKRREKRQEERLRRERETALLREAKLKATTIEQEKELEKQKIRNRIAQDLHDEIGSNLSSISLMSELVQKDGKINSDAIEKINRINKVAKGSTQAMRDIVWITNPSSDNIKDLVTKMNEVANDMLGAIKWKFDFPQSLSEITLAPETKRNVFFIYKEALNNILKHSGAGNVDIKLKFADKNLFLAIKDDGKGFNTATVFPGNGLKNLQNRTKEIKGILKLSSSPGKGTTLGLEFNITQVRD